MSRPSTPSLRISAVLLTFMLLSGLVAACGDSDSDSASSSAVPDTASATSAAPETSTSATDSTTAPDTTVTTTAAATIETEPQAEPPTIVLVHGAFADPSSWDPVATLLRAGGFEVAVPVNPLRGPTVDSAALRATLDGIDGDVIVVAHSYGGIPATNAAADDPDVRGLVYVAAYVPDEAETFGEIQERVPGQLTPDRLVIAPYTTSDGVESVGATVAVDAFADLFAADLPAEQSAAMAATQMPLDLAALADPSGPPAWRTIPSWYLLATADQIIPTELARMMAERAGATLEEVDASHAVLLSQPAVVAELISRASEESAT